MKLLIVTQKINREDPILGFFYKWIVEFAKNCELITIICLEYGMHELPANVRIFTLGKERRKVGLIQIKEPQTLQDPQFRFNRKAYVNRFGYIYRFYKYIWQERENYDSVFVHMNPIYVVLGGFIWKILGKKISLWYTHKNVDLKLRVAEKFADWIFTASKESFRLDSGKLLVTGHGIDVNSFSNKKMDRVVRARPISLLSVGRITTVKNGDVLIETAHVLKKKWDKKFEIVFAGSPMTVSDIRYKKKLTSLISKYGLEDEVRFVGDVLPIRIPEYYANSDATINLAPTGGLDKVVLESMAAGVPVFVTNETFRGYLGAYADILMFKEGDANDLAIKIMRLFMRNDVVQIGKNLQEVIRGRADLQMLVRTIFDKLS